MSAFGLVSSFFTPAYLFLFLNLIIGTIFLTSRRHRPHKPQPPPAPSSLIDRVRSFNLSLHKFDSHPPQPNYPSQRYYPRPVEKVADGSSSPPQLARAPSFLDRLRSVDFYQHKFEHVDPETDPEPLQRVDPPAPLSRAPSSLLDRLKSMNFYYQKFGDQSAVPAGEIERSGEARDHAAPLSRSPLLLERVRSLKFPSFYDPGPDAEPDHDDVNHQGRDAGHGPVRRIRSESERMGEGEEGPKPRMRKTASERSAEEEENAAAEEEINAKADDFIQRFRQQLRLQRLDSIMRYKDMLTGGR